MTASNYLELKLLDHALNVATFTRPSAIYVKLHTGAPGEAGTSNAALNTTRKAVTFAAASGGSSASNADVLWENVSNNETYSHISLWDNVTDGAGNCLYEGALSTPKAVLSGDNFKIASGNLTVSAD